MDNLLCFMKLNFSEDVDTNEKRAYQSKLLKENPGVLVADTKQSFNTVTNKMDLNFVTFSLNGTKQLEQLAIIIIDHYKLQNYFVKDPKPMNGGKRTEIEGTSNNENK